MLSDEIIRLAEFSQAVRLSTLKRISNIPFDFINWRSITSAMSFADIISHLIDTDEWLFRKIEDPSLKSIRGAAGAVKILSMEEYDSLLKKISKTGELRYELIRSLNEADLKRQIYDDRFEEEISLWWLIVRGNLDHEINHRGQIAAYLRITGIN